jgi:thymidylate synthase
VDTNGNIKLKKMNKLDLDYQNLLKDILENGVKKETRNGGTISVFGRQIRHDMKDGFPLLTTKKMPFKTIVTELLWFLRGDTNIKYLVYNNCHIWDGDAYKNYLKNCTENYTTHNEKVNETDIPSHWKGSVKLDLSELLTQEEFIDKIKTDDEFAKKWGDLGPIYGKQWRGWNGVDKEAFFNSDNLDERNKDARHSMFYKESEIDQLEDAIQLLKTDPDSRRNRVSAWNAGEIKNMVLPPCHTDFQFYTRELSRQERSEYYYKHGNSEGIVEGSLDRPIWKDDETAHKWYNERSVPTRAISLMWNQRSVDTFLGLPFNIASYGLLLEIIAKEVNMVPNQLIGNLGDVHLYSNHIEQAKEQIGREFTEEEILEHLQQSGMDALKHEPRMEYIYKLPKRTREPFPLPKLVMNPIFLANLEHKGFDEAINGEVNFQVENYQSHPTIKAPLSN